MLLHSAPSVRQLSMGRTRWWNASWAQSSAAAEEGVGSWRMDP